jgi:hypothetical protein
MGKDSSICLGCSKKFSKSDTSVQCTVCGLWIHKICANMSDEVFDLLEKQKKENGITYWACRPCTTFAQGMNHRLKQIAEELEEVKQSTSTNKEAIKQLEKKVEEVAEMAKKSDGISKEEMEARLKEEREEARERKDREANVIIHGLDECEEQGLSGSERMELDTQSSIELFAEAGIRVANHEIKFCRRVGPRAERARPLIVGLYNPVTRSRVLKADYTGCSAEVSVGPDLTRKQQEEEAEIWKEKDKRNQNRTADEKAKNLVWRLVGPKGDRRLVLGPDRQQESVSTGGAATKGAAVARGRGRGRVAMRAAGRGAPAMRAAPRSSLGVQLLDSTREEQQFRPRIGSKRKEREPAAEGEGEEMEEEMREPPTKH